MTRLRWPGLALSIAVVCLPIVAAAQAPETVGMITEIKVGRGKVEVKSGSAPEWRRAGPLAALRSGDAVRATEDATVVILLSGGRGTVKVDATKSPYTLPAAGAGAGKVDKLVQAGLGYLASSKETPKAVLSVRSASRPPVVITPRDGLVLADGLAFEWLGNNFSRYTVRVVGPSGTVFERKGVTGARLDYPAGAPPLVAGTRYTLEVQAGSDGPQRAWFEIMDAGRARTVAQDLDALEQGLGRSVSPSSLAVLKAGLLAREGLVHDARRVVLAALARDPDEPALHQLLGNLYVQTGLNELGAESHDEADFLVTRGGQ